MTITEFLTARYDEDEAVAREVQEKVRENDRGWASHYEHAEGSAASIIWDVDYCQGGYTITAARVLADIAAKRRLVELCATWRADGERHVAGRDAMSIAARTQAITAETVLRALAQPYAEHSDFDPAWRA